MSICPMNESEVIGSNQQSGTKEKSMSKRNWDAGQIMGISG
jgi:hypothetical protein